MKFRTTLILLALVIGLCVFLVLHTARQPVGSPSPDQPHRMFPLSEFKNLSDTDLPDLRPIFTRVELRSADTRCCLSRPDTRSPWRIALHDEITLRADPDAVSEILHELEILTAQSVLRPEPDRPLELASYGLDRAARSISFGTDNRLWTLHVGTGSADGKSVYVSRSGDPAQTVYVVPQHIAEIAANTPADLRDRAVFRFEPANVRRIEIAAPGRRMVCRIKEAGTWHLEQPVADRADARAVRKFLNDLAALRVGDNGFITDAPADLADFGLDAPSRGFVVHEGETIHVLLVGDEVPGRSDRVYAREKSGPSVFMLSRNALDVLPGAASDLRARNAVTFHISDVTRIELTVRDKERVALAKTDDKWTMLRPDGVVPDAPAVVSFLEGLLDLHIETWIDEPGNAQLVESGLAEPQVEVSLISGRSEPALALSFGSFSGSGLLCHARVGAKGPILLVPDAILTRALSGHRAFLSRTVLSFDRADAKRIEITWSDGTFVVERQGEKWMRSAPTRQAADSAAVDALLWSLCHVQAKRIIADKPENPARYGLSPPRIKVVISLAGAPAEKRALLLGEASGPDSVYAMRQGRSRVYTVSNAIADSLTACMETGTKK